MFGRWLACALVLACAGLSERPLALRQEPPQAPKSGTGLILGRVVDALSGRPIPRARVSTWLGHGEALEVLTDADGRFVLARLPAGPLTVRAQKGGYFDVEYGQRRPDEPASGIIELRDGERRGDVVLRIWKHAAIEGRVLDENGDPVVEVTVAALPKTYVAGRPAISTGGTPEGSTDDRGMFRITRLMPGDYVVAVPLSTDTAPRSMIEAINGLPARDPKRNAMSSALSAVGVYSPRATGPFTDDGLMRSTSSGPMPPDLLGSLVYPSTFHQSAVSVSAAAIVSVGAGEDVRGVDITLRPVRTTRVSGVVRRPDGPAVHMPAHLLPADIGGWTRPLPVARTVTDAAGAFTFLGVPPGAYRIEILKAPPMPGLGEGEFIAIGTGPDGNVTVSTSADGTRPPPPPVDPAADEMWWGSAAVSVSDADVRDLSIDLRRGTVVSGRVVVPERAAPGRRSRELSVVLESIDGRSGDGTMAGDYEQSALGRTVTGDDMTFKTRPLPPGRYLLRVQNRTVASAMFGGRDIAAVPLDLGAEDVTGVVVTLAKTESRITGVVRLSMGSPLSQTMSVLAFPTDPGGWVDFGPHPTRIRAATVERDGSFVLTGLPAGEYYIAPTDRILSVEAVHPDLLGALSRQAVRIRIRDGDERSVELTWR
jgi:hypothetical protein